MKRTYTVVAVLVVALVVCGYLYWRSGHEAVGFYDDQVRAIVNKGQLRPGELVENLAALGAEAIPAFHRAMLREDEEFPVIYVQALDIIGDARASVPLIDFLEQRRPFTNVNERELTIHTLLALARISDQVSDPLIEEIFRADAIHPRIRLYAAAALTKAKEDSLKQEANAHIFEQYTNAATQTRDPNERILDSDLYEALIVADNESSINYLASALGGHPMRHNAQRIVKYFSTIDDPTAVNALLAVVDDGYNYEVPVRLSALEGIVGKIDEDAAHSKAKALSAEAIEDGWSESEVNRAAELVAHTSGR